MKEGALHREWSLWNQLKLSQSHSISSDYSDLAVTDKNNDEKLKLDDNIRSTPYIENEKMPLDNFMVLNKLSRTFKLLSKLLFLTLVVISIKNFIVNDDDDYNNNNTLNSLDLEQIIEPLPKPILNSILIPESISLNNNENKFSLHNLYDSNFNDDDKSLSIEGGEEPHEIIDIPLIPYSNISSPIYSNLLLNYTFASSWNKPVLINYLPPPSNLTYNRIVLTLDTTVQGVQYDRLIHIYLEDTEIWRSSTIEPQGKLSHSFAQRDVTMYSKLFQNKGNLLIQLDNLVTPKLTGAFDISLSVLYFNDNDDNNNNLTHPNFIPLTPSKINKNVPPIVYYPDSPLSGISLPKINFNTTKLLLLLSTSGNAAEEFWYSNLLDKFKDSFESHDRHFYGHGSCRIINVFVNGIRVHSTNPKPYVFTGGIAPTLWNSIVSTGSFDLMPYHIDLSPILPLLWNDPSAILDIEISNCIDDDIKSSVKSKIGSNWITSASLAIWEDDTIVDSYGELELFDNSTSIKSFAIQPPFSGMLTQIIKASYINNFSTNITYIYNDGTEFTKLSNFENNVNQTSVIVVSKFGDSQSIISIPQSNSTISVFDASTLEIIKDLTMLSNSSISTKLDFLPTKKNIEDTSSPDISYNVNLTIKMGIGAYSGLTPLFEIKSKENGTADFTISSTGNHGTGSMLHNYTLTDIGGLSYSRVALAENDTVVYDNITETKADIFETSQMHDLSNESSNEFTLSFLSLAELDWLTNHELFEIENFLRDDEVAVLIDAILDESYNL